MSSPQDSAVLNSKSAWTAGSGCRSWNPTEVLVDCIAPLAEVLPLHLHYLRIAANWGLIHDDLCSASGDGMPTRSRRWLWAGPIAAEYLEWIGRFGIGAYGGGFPLPVVPEEELGVGQLAILPIIGIVHENAATGLSPLGHDLAKPSIMLFGERGYHIRMLGSEVLFFRGVDIEIE